MRKIVGVVWWSAAACAARDVGSGARRCGRIRVVGGPLRGRRSGSTAEHLGVSADRSADAHACGRADAADGPRPAQPGAAARGDAARGLRCRVASARRHAGPGACVRDQFARRGERLVVQPHAGRAPGADGRLQGAALRRSARPCVRLLRHDAAVPDQRGEPHRPIAGGRGARHVRPLAPRPDRDSHLDTDAFAPRVPQPQHPTGAARRGLGQPRDRAGAVLDLRPEPGLQAPGSRCDHARRAVRTRRRLLARRKHLLRRRDRREVAHRN